MKRIILNLLLLVLPLAASARMLLTVDGPNKSYSRVLVVNETSQEKFRCRVVLLDDKDEMKSVYGYFSLDEFGDEDSKISRIENGTHLGIEIPKNFPVETSFAVEYLKRPVFGVIVIHLIDAAADFE